MMRFINRDSELNYLEEIYGREGSQLIILYMAGDVSEKPRL